MFVGVDGCKAGWFAIVLAKDADWKVNVFPDASSLWDEYHTASVILIDIPIGLKDEGPEERRCDIEARKLLGRPRGSGVFRVPCRSAIYAKSYEKACALNKQLTGRQLSRQVWNITPKIREVDSLLIRDKSARLHVREIHPEVCFWALAGGRPMGHSKRTEAGFSKRMQILQSIYPQANDIFNHALTIYTRNQLNKDDILDALVAATTAKLGFLGGLVSIPKTPRFDSQGLRMEMVYYSQKEEG